MSLTERLRHPRHARLFELIRQEVSADKTMARLDQASHQELNASEALRLQQAAARSLLARPEARSQV